MASISITRRGLVTLIAALIVSAVLLTQVWAKAAPGDPAAGEVSEQLLQAAKTPAADTPSAFRKYVEGAVTAARPPMTDEESQLVDRITVLGRPGSPIEQYMVASLQRSAPDNALLADVETDQSLAITQVIQVATTGVSAQEQIRSALAGISARQAEATRIATPAARSPWVADAHKRAQALLTLVRAGLISLNDRMADAMAEAGVWSPDRLAELLQRQPQRAAVAGIVTEVLQGLVDAVRAHYRNPDNHGDIPAALPSLAEHQFALPFTRGEHGGIELGERPVLREGDTPDVDAVVSRVLGLFDGVSGVSQPQLEADVRLVLDQ